MFSSLLLRASHGKKEKVSRDPIVAQKIDMNMQTVAQVGRGRATCSYSIENHEDSLAFCVSSLLTHRDNTRQYVKVTNCQVSFSNRESGKHSQHSLSLSKLSKDGPKSLASLSHTRELHANTLSLYAGAISADDLFVSLGSVEAGTMLEIQIEFLFKFAFPPSSTTFQYVFTNKLPTHCLTYSLSLASSLPVDSVTPLHTSPSSTDFRWDHIAGPSVIQVQYECTSDDQLCVSGFSVQLATSFPSGCCSLAYSQDACSSSKTVTPGSSLSCDGVMMLNSSLSPDQFPDHIKSQPLHQSEFVFVIDCSGSMSGSNIQAATDTLITCIKSIPYGSHFNVIAFGSTFKHLFYQSVEYNKKNMEKAIQFANNMQASLGGTELLDPLRWIYKQQRRENLAKQIFLITDGGVNNTQHVLHTVRKNRGQARCHTFGIGPEVCVELVTGIAAASGGRSVLLKDNERLQTKVMEVLKESVQPYISDSTLQWTPPEGFSLIDSTPKSLGTVYSGSTHTAFAMLKREEPTQPSAGVCNGGSVMISGLTGNEQVQIDVGPVSLPPLTSAQSQELASILDRVVTWSKLQDLEMALMSSSRKNSNCETQEPEPKRIKLNGSTLNGKMVDSALSEELVDLSLSSGIPCLLTCFRGESLVQQMLPQKQFSTTTTHTSSTPSKRALAYQNQKRMAQLQKMQHRNRSRRKHDAQNTPATMSMCSIAKSTITAVGSTLKTVASSFGLVLSEPMEVQNGHRIEDHLEYQSQRKSALHWDETQQKLMYPKCYRTNGETYSAKAKEPYRHTQLTNGNGHRTSPSLESSSDDEDFSISDTESNSSLDPDWDDLRRPSELRPLLQMQLYSGAWPMIRAFSYAVGVPLEEVRKLLKETKQSSKMEKEDEEKANIWTTALALVCLQEYFPETRTEWEIVELKGHLWLEENLKQETDLTLTQVLETSRELVTKWLS